MTLLLLLPAILSFLALAAHWLHAGSQLLALVSVAICFLLLVPQRWVARVAQVVLILTSVVWGLTTYDIAQERIADQQDWIRAAVILLSVGAFSLLAAGLFQTRRLRARYRGCCDSNQKDAGKE